MAIETLAERLRAWARENRVPSRRVRRAWRKRHPRPVTTCREETELVIFRGVAGRTIVRVCFFCQRPLEIAGS